MKIRLNVDSNLRQIDVDFYVSMQEKTYCVQIYNSGKSKRLSPK